MFGLNGEMVYFDFALGCWCLVHFLGTLFSRLQEILWGDQVFAYILRFDQISGGLFPVFDNKPLVDGTLCTFGGNRSLLTPHSLSQFLQHTPTKPMQQVLLNSG
jgi:hypothetical protein